MSPFATDMINYTNATKHDLADELFIMDTKGHYGPNKANNKGFESRRLKFIDTKNPGLNDTWKQEPISVWTCLNTDFDGLKKSETNCTCSTCCFNLHSNAFQVSFPMCPCQLTLLGTPQNST